MPPQLTVLDLSHDLYGDIIEVPKVFDADKLHILSKALRITYRFTKLFMAIVLK